MIRFRVRELIAEKAFRDGSRLTITDVSAATGIARRVLSSLVNERGYNTGTDNVDRLCRYFRCQAGDVILYVPDEELASQSNRPKSQRK